MNNEIVSLSRLCLFICLCVCLFVFVFVLFCLCLVGQVEFCFNLVDSVSKTLYGWTWNLRDYPTLHVYTNQIKETALLEIAVESSTMSVSHTLKHKCKATPVLFKHTSRIKTKLYLAFKISPLFLLYMYIVVFCVFI